MDLSQSAGQSKNSSDTIGRNASQHPCPSGGSVTDAANASGVSFISSAKHVSSAMLRDSLTFLPVCGSTFEGRALSVNGLPHNSACEVFTIPSGGINRNTVTPDILRSAGACLASFNTTVMTDTMSAAAASASTEKISAGNTGFGTDNSGVPYPKTKKQKAVDSKVSPPVTSSLLSPTLGDTVSEYETLTFGEIQERLITKVVESGSLSGALCGDQQRVVTTNKHHITGISTGKLPMGRFPYGQTLQYRPHLAADRTPSERCNLQKASSLSVPSTSLSPTKQQSVVSTTQGLWFQNAVFGVT